MTSATVSLLKLMPHSLQFITQVFSEKRPLDTVGVNVAAKLLETVGLALVLNWWGTRTNPFE